MQNIRKSNMCRYYRLQSTHTCVADCNTFARTLHSRTKALSICQLLIKSQVCTLQLTGSYKKKKKKKNNNKKTWNARKNARVAFSIYAGTLKVGPKEKKNSHKWQTAMLLQKTFLEHSNKNKNRNRSCSNGMFLNIYSTECIFFKL